MVYIFGIFKLMKWEWWGALHDKFWFIIKWIVSCWIREYSLNKWWLFSEKFAPTDIIDPIEFAQLVAPDSYLTQTKQNAVSKLFNPRCRIHQLHLLLHRLAVSEVIAPLHCLKFDRFSQLRHHFYPIILGYFRSCLGPLSFFVLSLVSICIPHKFWYVADWQWQVDTLYLFQQYATIQFLLNCQNCKH